MTSSSDTPRHLITFPGSEVTMPFRLILAGEFSMGQRGEDSNEEPIYRVVIPHDFWMGETPVTQAQFAFWTFEEGIEHKNEFPNRSDHPAENMYWFEAARYCEWLTRTRGADFPEGFTLARLPGEAEWEYACRGGTETDYHSGDGEAALAEAGWYGENSGAETHPVGKKLPNTWGLYDMHGNVWEWCHDEWVGATYRQLADGDHAPTENRENKESRRVVRGGSWDFAAWWCRSASRGRFRSGNRTGLDGFRLGLFPGPVKPDARDGSGEIDLAQETLPDRPV